MGYGLAVDLGTTWTGAAVVDGDRISPVMLDSHQTLVPSLVHVDPQGEWTFGITAERRAAAQPDGLARAFKRSFGDSVPQILSDRSADAAELTGRLLRWVVDSVSEQRGDRPHTVVVTHPAHWSSLQRSLLRETCGEAVGEAALSLLSEPEAIAIHFATEHDRPVGYLAVYDFGGGTFDATILATTETGFRMVGEPVGRDSAGGIDLDDLIVGWALEHLDKTALEHLDRSDPLVLAGLRRLREEALTAKETLSSEATALVRLSLPTMQDEFQLHRSEFEHLARPLISSTLEAVVEATRKANITVADLDLILLAGGSSQVPLVSELMAAELGIETSTALHPKLAVAVGAAATMLPDGPRFRPTKSRAKKAPLPVEDDRPSVDDGLGGEDAGFGGAVPTPPVWARRPAQLAAVALVVLLSGLAFFVFRSDDSPSAETTLATAETTIEDTSTTATPTTAAPTTTPPLPELEALRVVSEFDVGDGLWSPILVGSDLWVPRKAGVAVINIEDGGLTALDFEGWSETPLFADGRVWVPNLEVPTLTVIDPIEKTVIDTVAVGQRGLPPVELDGHIWVSNRADATVSRVDMVTLEELTIELSPGFTSLLVVDGHIETRATDAYWRINPDGEATQIADPGPLPVVLDGDEFRVDEDRTSVSRASSPGGEPIATIPTGPGTGQLTVSGDWIWASTAAGFVRIDLETNEADKPIPVNANGGFVGSDTGLWIATRGDVDGQVTFIQSETQSFETIDVPGRPDIPIPVNDGAYVSLVFDSLVEQVLQVEPVFDNGS